MTKPSDYWRPIATAPRDGTLFDAWRDGIRFTDCRMSEFGVVRRERGYPAVDTVFVGRGKPTHWAPRPPDLIAPYELDSQGRKYVP